jgi:hypothetical protein
MSFLQVASKRASACSCFFLMRSRGGLDSVQMQDRKKWCSVDVVVGGGVAVWCWRQAGSGSGGVAGEDDG